MSAARIDSAGKITSLDGRAEPDEIVTEEDAKEPAKVARLLTRVLVTLASMRRAFIPRRIDFEDITTTAAPGTVRLQHNFNGRVRWWQIDYQISGAAAAPIIQRDSGNTDANTLVLLTYTTGVVSIRVEEAG